MAVAVLGEALIDFIADQDGAYRAHLGGSPYNVAMALARQQVPVNYLSPLSDDRFGDQLLQSLLDEGVHIAIKRRSHWPTSLALVTVDDAGTAAYRLYREGIADKDTSFDELIDVIDSQTQVFHTGSLAITPSQLPKIRQLVAALRERGVCIAIDINIRLGASIDTERYLAGVRSLLPLADIIKASDEDLEPFGYADTPRAAAEVAYAQMEGGVLVLTEGKGGAVVFTPNGVLSRPATQVGTVVDTIGAGDTFHANLIAALLRADAFAAPLESLSESVWVDAIDYACMAAAINVTRVGCNPPTPEEVRSAMLAGTATL
ncbi:MAG: carbohydrate kinase [Pseudomonadota bacterium]